MRLSTGAILILFLSGFHLFAQSGDYRVGARPMGMAFTSGTLSDPWSGFSNIGSLAMETHPVSAGFSYQSLYSLKGFGKKAAALCFPVRKFQNTLNFFSLGDVHFSETRVGLGFSHRIRFVSLGIQVNYVQMAMELFGTSRIFYLDAGGVAELFPGLLIGVAVQNPGRAKWAGKSGELFPFQLSVTVSYHPQENLYLNVQWDENSGVYPGFKAGMEYGIHSLLFLRTGISTKPVKNYFGLGVGTGIFKFDYALSMQTYLGYCHQISLCLFPIKRK